MIDAHLHLWDTGRLRYEWLQRPGLAAINRTFGFEDFRVRAEAAGVDRAVLVQADDSAADTEAMFEVAAAHPEIAGVVAWVPLDRPDEAAARLRARPGFAGIRTLIHDQPDPDWLLRPEVGEGLALLERGGVPFDVISVLPRHLSHVPVLSERYPALRMVLDHPVPPAPRRRHQPVAGADHRGRAQPARVRQGLRALPARSVVDRRGPAGRGGVRRRAVRAGPADVRQRLAGGRTRRRLRQGPSRSHQALRPARGVRT